MFNELVRDNMQIVSLCGNEEIAHIISLLATNKDANFLEFLSVLSVCEGTPVKAMQDKIGQHLLSVPEPPVYLTDVNGKLDGTIDVRMDGKNTRQSIALHLFAEDALDELDETSTPEYLFLQRQLELYGNLCKGRNEANIKYITETHKHLTWEECFLSVQSDAGAGPQNQRQKTVTLLVCPPHEGPPDTNPILGSPDFANVRKKADIIIASDRVAPNQRPVFKKAVLNRLPQSLRSIYVDIIVSMFVDVGENRDVLSEVDLSFNWDTLSTAANDAAANDQTMALSGAKFQHFPELKKWIYSVLNNTEAMVHVDSQEGQPKNKLLCSVLSLLHTLIVFGYYADPTDIMEMMVPLKGVINGTNDFRDTKQRQQQNARGEGGQQTGSGYAKWLGSARYQADDDHGRIVCDAKHKALVCVEALYNYVFNVRLRYLLCDFKLVFGGKYRAQSMRSSVKGKDQKRIRDLQAKGYKSLLSDLSEDEVAFSPEVTEKARAYVANLSEQCNWITASAWQLEDGASDPSGKGALSLVGILLDLARYQDDRLLTKSLQLVNRMYSSQQDLFDLAVQAKVLETKESKQMLKLKDMLPTLKRLGSRNISGKDVQHFNTMLCWVTSKCYWEGNVESTPRNITFGGRPYAECWSNPGPHNATNQQIIFNSGILPIVLNVVRRDNQPRSVLRNCFWFLRALCISFQQVQIILYESLDTILSTQATPEMSTEDQADEDAFESWENSMGGTVDEIFNNCRETCLRVTADQVEAMLHRVGEGDAEKTFRTAKLLNALRAVAKVEEWNLPLKRNQELIIKHLWTERKRVIDIAEIDDASDEQINKQRIALLSRENNNTDKQTYHLNLVKLIAATCEGENRQIEAMCRSIFTLTELLDTITGVQEKNGVFVSLHTNVDHINKGPYIAFLLWAYLNTGSTSAEVGTDTLDDETRLFEAFKNIAVQEVASYQQQASLTPTQSEFFYDAFIPCAQKLCENHFPRNTAAQRHLFQMALTISDFLNSVLREGQNTTGIDRFRAQYVVELFNSLNKRMMGHHNQTGRIVVVEPTVAEKNRFEKAYTAVSSEALKLSVGVVSNAALAEYERRYHDEEETNRRFNNFVRNLETAYKSNNTIGDQLALSSQLVDDQVQMQTYCGDASEDEALPLGPEFQHLVALFARIEIGAGKAGKGNLTMDLDCLAILVRLFEANHGAVSSSEQERNARAQTSVKLLCVVRAIVHNTNQLDLDPAHVIKFQDGMTNVGAVLVVASLFSSPSAEVRKQALATLNAILDGGNRSAQDIFTSYFLRTREERFFEDVSALIELSTESIINLRTLREQKRESDATSDRLQDTMRGTLTRRMDGAQNKPRGVLPGVGKDDNTVHVDGVTVYSNDPKGMVKDLESTDNQVIETEDPLKMKDHGNLRLLLLVLKAMCEGNNTVIQNYLRQQADNIKNINVIEMVTSTLGVLVQELQPEVQPLIIQCLSTITEFIQGNHDNRRQVFDARIIDYVNTLVRSNANKELHERLELMTPNGSLSAAANADQTEKANTVVTMDIMCAELLDRMLETNDSNTAYLAKECDKILDVGCILRLMRLYLRLDENLGKTYDSGNDLPLAQVAFQYFNITSRLQHFSGKSYASLDHIVYEDELWQSKNKTANTTNQLEALDANKFSLTSVFDKVADTSASIELLVEGVVQKYNFFVDPAWRTDIPSEAKQTLLWSIDRGSMVEQSRDFIEKSRVIIADMKYMNSMLKSSHTSRFVLENRGLWSKMMLYVTLLINILMTVTWVAPIGDGVVPIYAFSEDLSIVMLALGCAHVALTFLVVVSFFLANPPSLTSAKTDEEKDAAARDAKGQNFDIIRVLQEGALFGVENRTRYSIFSGAAFYHVLLLVLSALGLVFWGYTFAFHLLHIVVGNDILKRVIQAVTAQTMSLLYVGALLFIIIYIYSVISFALMREYFDRSEGAHCSTMYQCFFTSIRLGLLAGGGLGDALPYNGEFTYFELGVRPIFDVTFFILVTIIGLNVVFGIIVDSFSELRDEKFRIESQMTGECFICGIKSAEFDRNGSGWNAHKKSEHNMWNYLEFFIHLDIKDATEYTYIEHVVCEMILSQDYSFFPTNRSLSLDRSEDEDSEGGAPTGHYATLEANQARILELQMKLLRLTQASEGESERAPRPAARMTDIYGALRPTSRLTELYDAKGASQPASPARQSSLRNESARRSINQKTSAAKPSTHGSSTMPTVVDDAAVNSRTTAPSSDTTFGLPRGENSETGSALGGGGVVTNARGSDYFLASATPTANADNSDLSVVEAGFGFDGTENGQMSI